MLKVLLIVLALGATVPFLQAQLVPGYLGKRHYLEIAATLGPNHFPMRRINHPYDKGGQTAVAFRPSIAYNGVASRKVNLRASYSTMALNINHPDYNGRFSIGFGFTNYVGYRVTAHAFSLGADLYPNRKRPGSLAPLGGFLRLGMQGIYSQRTTTPRNDFVTTEELAHTAPFALGVEFGGGYRAVLSQRLLLTISFQGVLLLNTLPTMSPFRHVINDASDRLQRQTLSALQERSLIGISLGLGVFLF